MKYRQLDDNGDFTFGSGAANYLQNSPETVAQAVQTRLALNQGEWFLDITEGTDRIPTGDKALADSIVRNRILDTQGVQSIDSFESTFDGEQRAYVCYATITTIYGAAEVFGVF